MGIRSSRCPDSGHQKQMSGDRGYRRLEQDDMLKYVPFVHDPFSRRPWGGAMMTSGRNVWMSPMAAIIGIGIGIDEK